MTTTVLGTRIRERRRALGITQAELARRLGISASYLNLIERNKRRLSHDLVERAADAMGLKSGELDGAGERRLAEQLAEIAADPRLEGLGLERDAIGEFIARYPGWARALGALAREARDQADLARAAADRLSHDPFLGETAHRMLTRVAAIRSTAQILEAVPEIGEAQARRFHAILAAEAEALTEVSESMAAYFDRAAERAHRVTPVDEVEAMLLAAGNRFPALEAALAGAELPRSASRLGALVEMRAGPVIDRLIAEAPELTTASARARARPILARYAMDAVLAPEGRFAEAARAARYDLERLASGLDLPADVVCRRLATLEPAEGVPRIGYVAANGAGALVDLRDLPGFHPVRHGTLCPLWVLARVAMAPERAECQLASFPTGRRFVFVARAARIGEPGFGAPRHLRLDMLVIPEADAGLTVYGDRPLAPEEVGPSCRVCPRKGCAHRVDDPLAA